jgi:GTPase SAR1 family protein
LWYLYTEWSAVYEYPSTTDHRKPSQVKDRFSIFYSRRPESDEFESHGKWVAFKRFDEIDDTWENIRTAMDRNELGGCEMARCSTMKYDPTKGGPGPCTYAVICVYTDEHNVDATGLKLIQIIKEDIKYKTNESSRKHEFSFNVSWRVTNKTIFWNRGKPSTIHQGRRTSSTFSNTRDDWHINIVTAQEPVCSEVVHGRWTLTLEYMELTALWHHLKNIIESKEKNFGIISMECPPKSNPRSKTELPVFNIYTSVEHHKLVGEKLIQLVQRDIHYYEHGESRGIMNSLSWKDHAAESVREYLKSYQHVISTKVTIEIPFVNIVFLGASRLGKTTMRRRLTREIDDIDSAGEGEQPSTGILESEHNVLIRKLSSSTAVVTSTDWSSIKGISKEARMLFQLIHQTGSRGAPVFPRSPDQLDHVVRNNIKLDTETPPAAGAVSSPEGKSESDVNLGSLHKEDAIMSEQEIQKFFTKALSSNLGEMKSLLEETYSALLSMSDLGGQPEFMDMHPALVLGPALYLIFCKLTQGLEDRYNVTYLESSGNSTIPVKSVYTVEEVIFQALSAVACLGIPTNSGASEGSSQVSNVSKNIFAEVTGMRSKALIVGTHSDLVSKEKIKEFDTQLQRKIRATDFFENDLVKFLSEDRVVLDVNNKNGGVAEVKKIQKVIEDEISLFPKLPLPVSWLMFSLCLRSKRLKMVPLEKCLHLAEQLQIPRDEALLAIWFLHHHAGLLMHFRDVPELRGSVICDTQLVYDSLTHLIVNTFKFGAHVSKAASERFKDTGQFSLQDIRKVVEKAASPGDCIPLEKLVKLLEYLNIIARISETEAVFFMPCVLPNASSSELDVKPSKGEVSPLPLMIRFTCGFIPTGVFTAMIANLFSQLSVKKMIVEGMKKNRIQFYYGDAWDKVTVISRSKHYEIHISRRSKAKSSLHKVCNAVRDLIQHTLKTVTFRFNYTFSLSYELGFECPLHNGVDHLCVVKESGGAEPEVMTCLHNPKELVPIDLEDEHLLWWGKVSLCSYS